MHACTNFPDKHYFHNGHHAYMKYSRLFMSSNGQNISQYTAQIASYANISSMVDEAQQQVYIAQTDMRCVLARDLCLKICDATEFAASNKY